MEKAIKEYLKTNSLPNERYTLFAPNSAGEMELRIKDNDHIMTVRFRNVHERNPEAQIQFSIEEYTISTNRTKYVSFSIPAEMVELFQQHLFHKTP